MWPHIVMQKFVSILKEIKIYILGSGDTKLTFPPESPCICVYHIIVRVVNDYSHSFKQTDFNFCMRHTIVFNNFYCCAVHFDNTYVLITSLLHI